MSIRHPSCSFCIETAASAEVGLEQPVCEGARTGFAGNPPTPSCDEAGAEGEEEGSENRHVAPEEQPVKCLWILGLNSLQKAQMALSDPRENLGVETVSGDGLRGKGPFLSLPGMGNCSPNKKQSHFSLGSWPVRCIHLVFMNLALTVMARHRGLWQ